MTRQNPSAPTPFVAAVFSLIRLLIQMMSNGLTYTFSRFNDHQGFSAACWFHSGVSVCRLHPDARHAPILNESMIAGMLGGIKPPQWWYQLLVIGLIIRLRSCWLQAVYVNTDQLLNNWNDWVSLVKSAGLSSYYIWEAFLVLGFCAITSEREIWRSYWHIIEMRFFFDNDGVSDGVWWFVWEGWKHWKASYPKWIKWAFHHSSIVRNKEMHADTIKGWKGQSEDHDNHRGEGTDA